MTYDGRIEARFTIPSGGASVSVTNSGGGPTTSTVDAGSYYLTAAGGVSGLLADFQTKLNTDQPANWTVTLSTTTGKVTIDCADEPWVLSWTSTNLRDALGFTGNIASTTSAQTGANQARFLWIPDCPPNSDIPDHAQAPRVTDRHATRGPTGLVIAHVGNTMYRHPGWRYSHVLRRRVWKGEESTTNESWERFLEDSAFGIGHAWGDSQCRVQIYDVGGALVGLNANSGSGVSGWNLVGPGINALVPKPVSGQWVGQWRIDGFDLESDG